MTCSSHLSDFCAVESRSGQPWTLSEGKFGKRRMRIRTAPSENQRVAEELRSRQIQISEELQRERDSLSRQVQERIDKIHAYETELNERAKKISDVQHQLDSRIISYKELQDENGLLKRDSRNLAVGIAKLELDRTVQQQTQAELDQKVQDIGGRYLKENVKWIGKSLNVNNFAACKQRLQEVIERCRGIGFQITNEEEQSYIGDLRSDYEKEVRAAFEREEQARIKAQIREEQKVEREIQREQERIAREKAVVQAALAKGAGYGGGPTQCRNRKLESAACGSRSEGASRFLKHSSRKRGSFTSSPILARSGTEFSRSA